MAASTRILALMLALLMLLGLTACSTKQEENGSILADTVPSMSSTAPAEVDPWDIPPTVFMTEAGESFRFILLYDFYTEVSYEDFFDFNNNDGYKEDFAVSPKQWDEYKDNFAPNLPDTNQNREFIEQALSDSPEVRLKLANAPDCPDELLAYIAMHEPDVVVRFRALGNILARKEFPKEYLLQMTEGKFADTRYVSLLHDNRDTYETLLRLLDDNTPLVLAEAIAIGEEYLKENYPEEFQEYITATCDEM